jgi:hypothetical protein
MTYPDILAGSGQREFVSGIDIIQENEIIASEPIRIQNKPPAVSY